MTTAADLRAKYMKPYTLAEILNDADSVAATRQAIRGYASSRLTDAVAAELRRKGFTLTSDRDEVVISWKDEDEWKGAPFPDTTAEVDPFVNLPLPVDPEMAKAVQATNS